MQRLDHSSSARVLAMFLLPALLLTGCGKDAEQAAAESDEASTKTPAAAKTPEKNTKPLDLYAKAAPAQLLLPKELKDGKPLVKSNYMTAYGALTPDGKSVYVGLNDPYPNAIGVSVKCVEIASQTATKELPARGAEIKMLALSANGAALGITRDQAKSPGLVEIWDTAKGERKSYFYHPHKKEGITNTITGLDLSPDGKIAVSVSAHSEPSVGTKTYFGWSAETGKKLWSIDTPIYTSNVRFSRDGKLVLLWSNGAAVLVDAKTGEIKERYPTTHRYLDTWLEFSKNEKEILVLAHTDDQPDSCFARIERATGKRMLSQLTGVNKSGQMLFLADGQHVALLFNAGDLKVMLLIFKIRTGELKASYQVKGFATEGEAILLPDGNTFLIDNKLYDLSAQK